AGQQAVDQLRAPLRAAVPQKDGGLVGGGQFAGQVEAEPAEEGRVVGHRRQGGGLGAGLFEGRVEAPGGPRRRGGGGWGAGRVRAWGGGEGWVGGRSGSRAAAGAAAPRKRARARQRADMVGGCDSFISVSPLRRARVTRSKASEPVGKVEIIGRRPRVQRKNG